MQHLDVMYEFLLQRFMKQTLEDSFSTVYFYLINRRLVTLIYCDVFSGIIVIEILEDNV